MSFIKSKSALTECANRMKQNPNNYPIIKKYNKKIFDRYKLDIFYELEELIDYNIMLSVERGDFFDGFSMVGKKEGDSDEYSY